MKALFVFVLVIVVGVFFLSSLTPPDTRTPDQIVNDIKQAKRELLLRDAAKLRAKRNRDFAVEFLSRHGE